MYNLSAIQDFYLSAPEEAVFLERARILQETRSKFSGERPGVRQGKVIRELCERVSPVVSPNDVLLGPDGALYFTDPTLDLVKGEKQEIPYQGVYRLAADGSLRLLTKDLSQPNGLAFSPDGRKLYIDDSMNGDIHVYDVDSNGNLSHGRLFAKEEGPPETGVPDGMRVDRQGNLYVTGPRGIWIWSPSGKHLGTIVIPELAANLIWGGPAWDTLYITATTSVYQLKTKVRGFVPYE